MSEAFRKVGGQGYMTSVGVFVEKKKKSIQDSFFRLNMHMPFIFSVDTYLYFFLLITYISIFTNDTYFYLYS